MKENLISTLRLECLTFLKSSLLFVTQCFEMQDLIKILFPAKTGEIHPFGWRISSISGFTFAVFSYYFMNDYEMFSVMHPFIGKNTKTSLGEYEWTSYMDYTNSGEDITSTFNSFDGQKGFGKHFVDGYSAKTKTVYQYKGCEFHFHIPPDCLNPKNAGRTIDSANSFGTPLKKLLERDQRESDILKKYYSFDVKEIKTIYECEWKHFKKNNAFIMDMFWMTTGLPKKRPLTRLTPRATLRGGFIEVYRLKFCLADNPGWTLHFADANSLYSHIALTNQFPVGKYEVLLHKHNLKKNITFVNGNFFYNGQSMKGDAAHVKVLPPSDLFRPYLPYRLNDEYSHMALCRACLQNKMQKNCIHLAEDVRSFTSCYQITDLEKAVSLGYKIIEWYEVHHYQARTFLFTDFVKILAAQKLRNSNLINNEPENEKVNICDKINIAMQFPDRLKLHSNNICDNPAQKQLYKEMLNSFYGRFALHTNFTHHYFCRNLHEIERFASKENTQIVDIFAITDDVCEIEVITPTKIKPSLSGTLYITSEINALARKFIYEKSEEIEKVNGIVLSMDTDSIFFALPPGTNDPLIYSHAFGDFKTVLGDESQIESFYSLGPRNYSVTYKDLNGTEQHLLKVKGLSTKSSNNCDTISSDLYQNFIEKTFKSEVDKIYIPQMRKKVEKQTKKFHEILTYFNFGNEIHAKRFIVKKKVNYVTFPYGYKL
jgi:hypothetical protein